MKMEIPEKVGRIISTLKNHGYEAYAVGGCVRDTILGRTPEDWDITTSATPDETKALFDKTVDTGIEHGTITVLIDREGFEVTTYRIDGEYEDSRHPKEVLFTRSLEEDLKRRDFTINAMAYNEEEGLVDIFGGVEDLKNKLIRCVGEPKERFSEDALRILRAVRFSAQLGFAIEENTRAAIQVFAKTLQNISAERIQTELVKLLVSSHPEKVKELYKLGITKIILWEFDPMMQTSQETPYHDANVGEHTLRVLRNVRADKYLRLTALLHDVGKPDAKTVDEKGIAHFKGRGEMGEVMAKKILKRLKFDNDTLRKVCLLVRYHDYLYQDEITAKKVRRAMNLIGKEMFPYYLEIRKADIKGQSSYRRKEKEENIKAVEMYYRRSLENQECVSIKELAVRGKDLIAVGISPGPRLGKILERLLDEVIDEPERNKKDILLQKAREYIKLENQ